MGQQASCWEDGCGHNSGQQASLDPNGQCYVSGKVLLSSIVRVKIHELNTGLYRILRPVI